MFSWQNFLVGLGNQVENFERRSVIFGDAVSQRVLKTKLIILERDFLLLNFQDQEKYFLDQALCLTFIFGHVIDWIDILLNENSHWVHVE